MPPKKTGSAAAPKKAAQAPAHGSYQDMVKDAIRNLKDRSGSSRQAIKKYIQANNNLGGTTDAAFNTHINRALTNGEKAGVFARPKGPSGPVKLAKPPAAEKPAAKSTAKPAAKKSETKKAAPKKATTAATKTKAAPKAKAAPKKSTANAGKPRKTAAAAPAVEEKPPVVLGKTKSGRVTKSKAPAADKKKTASAPKKAAAKKAAPKKKAETAS